MTHDPFKALRDFIPGPGRKGKLYSLPALEQAGIGAVSRLPVSLRIVLEAVLRNCDGTTITADHVRQLTNWSPAAPRTTEIPLAKYWHSPVAER